MSNYDPLIWQALGFTLTAFAVIGLSIWWLYFSRLKDAPEPSLPSPRMGRALAGLLGLSAALMISGALWDASMHLLTGEVPGGEDFLWPPHLMIYSAFLLSLLVAGVSLAIVARRGWRGGQRDPRRWVRAQPYLGVVVLASGFSLLSVPGDALWHELFGVDLTAWSPPHVMLALTSGSVLAAGVALLARGTSRLGPTLADRLGMMALLGLMLNVFLVVGTLEWELPGELHHLVLARPGWSYPVVSGSLALITLALAKAIIPSRWSATGAAIAFYLFRLGVTAGLGLTGNIAPDLPLPFLLGALAFDLIPWRRIRPAFARLAAASTSYAAGFAALALPDLVSRPLPVTVSGLDLFLSVLLLLVAGLAILPLAERLARGLRST